MSSIILGTFVGIISSILSFQILKDIDKASKSAMTVSKRAVIYTKYSITFIFVVWCLQAMISTID